MAVCTSCGNDFDGEGDTCEGCAPVQPEEQLEEEEDEEEDEEKDEE